MPILRRGADPGELAGVLRRLERLQIGARAGWLPPTPPDDVPPVEGAATASVAPSPPVGASQPVAGRFAAVDPGRRGVAVLAAVALLGVGGGIWYFMRAAPTPDRTDASASVAPLVDGASSTTAAAPAAPLAWPTISAVSSATSSGAVVVIDVVGRVEKPGVVTLPANARVDDAIEAAGGALPGTDLTALDLAGKLTDGAEIFVGIPPPSGAAAQAGGAVLGVVGGAPVASTGASAGSIVNLNTATLADLETLPGVGAVTAQRILTWRAQHGGFASVTQLQQVSGIGAAKYAALAKLVTV